APLLKLPTVSSPALAGDRLVFGEGMHQTDGASLYCLRAGPGVPQWQREVPGTVVRREGSAVVAGGGVYVGVGLAGGRDGEVGGVAVGGAVGEQPVGGSVGGGGAGGGEREPRRLRREAAQGCRGVGGGVRPGGQAEVAQGAARGGAVVRGAGRGQGGGDG